MPISLRLPAAIETQIAGFSARQGVSKSAVIVRSIEEFLAKNAQPSSFEIYQQAMRDSALPRATNQPSDAERASAELRPVKLQVRTALRRKHAARATRASQALLATASDTSPTRQPITRRSPRKAA
jgi:hypothetical protein